MRQTAPRFCAKPSRDRKGAVKAHLHFYASRSPPSLMNEIAAKLRGWYSMVKRDLPWRNTRDPYRIWLSEIMLQQTRVAAALPYYERFLTKFPTIEELAKAAEPELLAAWAGLGYYTRARNLQKAARLIAQRGRFPRDYAGIRELPGVGDYTAAAIASIAFGLPHAVLDGNVARVLSRVLNERGDIRSPKTRLRLQTAADALLDRREPGEFNQAMMELGATVCLPRQPKCLLCPIASDCEAKRLGSQSELPVKTKGKDPVFLERTVFIVERRDRILLRQRASTSSLMPGFWDLPEAAELPGAEPQSLLGSFRHSITYRNYSFTVHSAKVAGTPDGFQWIPETRLQRMPLSTIAKKALRCLAQKNR